GRELCNCTVGTARCQKSTLKWRRRTPKPSPQSSERTRVAFSSNCTTNASLISNVLISDVLISDVLIFDVCLISDAFESAGPHCRDHASLPAALRVLLKSH